MRINYENTAVGIVNDLILSHTGAPRDPKRNITSETRQANSPNKSSAKGPLKEKMADIFLPDSGSMNPVLNDYLLQLPKVPSQKSPVLPTEAAIWWTNIPELGESNMVEAIWDYEAPPGEAGILSFKKADVGVKVSKEQNGWLGVKIGEKTGWVPVLYWATYVVRPKSKLDSFLGKSLLGITKFGSAFMIQ